MHSPPVSLWHSTLADKESRTKDLSMTKPLDIHYSQGYFTIPLTFSAFECFLIVNHPGIEPEVCWFKHHYVYVPLTPTILTQI